MTLRIDNVVTSGIFSIDGEDFEVDNNIWLVGDDDEVIVVDAAHDHRPIVSGIGSRRVVAVVCTSAIRLGLLAEWGERPGRRRALGAWAWLPWLAPGCLLGAHHHSVDKTAQKHKRSKNDVHHADAFVIKRGKPFPP